MDRVPPAGAVHRPQRGALRRGQASCTAHRGRCARGPAGVGGATRRLDHPTGVDRQGRGDARRPQCVHCRSHGTRRRSPAELRAGGGRCQRAGNTRRLRAHRIGWSPGRAQHQLALPRISHLRLRVRLLHHGLRGVGWLGGGDRQRRTRAHLRARGRRCLHDDELRYLLRCPVGHRHDRSHLR